MTTQTQVQVQIVAQISGLDMLMAQNNKEVATLKAIDVAAMTSKEMAEFIGVARVSDRKTGAVRVAKAIQARIDGFDTELVTIMAEKAELESQLVAASAATTLRQDGTRPSAAAAISKSWSDEEVRAKRLTRQAVCVNGEEFRSTQFAFDELGLPSNKAIKFRMALKAAGFATFTYNGKDYNFVIAS